MGHARPGATPPAPPPPPLPLPQGEEDVEASVGVGRWADGSAAGCSQAALEQVQSLKKDIMGRLESIEPHTVARRLHMSTVSPGGGSPRAWSEASARGGAQGGDPAAGPGGAEAPPGRGAFSEPLVAVLKDEVRKLGLRLEHSLQQSRQMEVRAREQVQRQGDEIEALKLENAALRRSCDEADHRVQEQLRAERGSDARLTDVVHRHVKATQAALSSAEPSCVRWVDMERDLPRALADTEKQVREMCRLYAAQRGQYAGLISDAAAAREQVTRQVEHSDRKLLLEMERWRSEANSAREALDRLQAEHLELQAEYALCSSWAQPAAAPSAPPAAEAEGAEVEALRSSLRALRDAYADKDRDLGQLRADLAAAKMSAATAAAAPAAQAAPLAPPSLGQEAGAPPPAASAPSTTASAASVPAAEPADAPAPALGGDAESVGRDDDENPEAEYWQSDTVSPGEDDAAGAGGGGPGEAEAPQVLKAENRDSVFSDGSDWSHESSSDANAAESAAATGSSFSFPMNPTASTAPAPPAPPAPPSPPGVPAPPAPPSRPAPAPPSRQAPAPPPRPPAPEPHRSSASIMAEAERRASDAAPPPPVPQHLSAAGEALRRMSGAEKPAGPPSAMKRAVEASKKRENKRISFAKMDAGGRSIKVNQLPSGGKYKMSYSKDVYYVHPTDGFWREVNSGQFREVLSSELPTEIARRM